ncbi:MAG: dihydrofolate reductase [bacterium]|nr:dihydrofolate reductase [bacterium]
MISIIAAIARNGVIGKDNQLPWRLPTDMKRFRALTIDHSVIMGRKTFDSLDRKALKRRANIVISRCILCFADVFTVRSFPDALDTAKKVDPEATEIFVIGGAKIYKEALPIADKMYLTLVDHDSEGDVFFPEYDRKDWIEVDRSTVVVENGYKYEWVTFLRKLRTEQSVLLI